MVKLYLVITAYVCGPLAPVGMALFWPMQLMDAQRAAPYYEQACDKTVEFFYLVIPAMIFGLLAKKAFLKLASLLRVNVRTA